MEIYRSLRSGFSGRGRRSCLAVAMRRGVRTDIRFGISFAVAHISPHQVYDTHVSRLTSPSRWCGFWWWCSGPGGSSAWISGCNWQHNCRFSWSFLLGYCSIGLCCPCTFLWVWNLRWSCYIWRCGRLRLPCVPGGGCSTCIFPQREEGWYL